LIGKMLPLYYAADALRKVIVLSASSNQIFMDIMVLALYFHDSKHSHPDR